MTANLMSPLLINLAKGLGKQVVIDKPHYSHQHRVIAAESRYHPQWNSNEKAVNDKD
jgi:flagellar assembly factor FliW